jgi:hypothetical protein
MTRSEYPSNIRHMLANLTTADMMPPAIANGIIDIMASRYYILYASYKHDPLRHIAQQLLGFSLSFQSTPHLHLKNAATLPPSTVVTSPVVFIANA